MSKKKPPPDSDSVPWWDVAGQREADMATLRAMGRTLADAGRELRNAWRHRHDDDTEEKQ